MLIALVGMAFAGGAYDVLKLRDGGSCLELGTGPAVRDELIALAEGDVLPYVSIRAADCLVAGFSGDAVVVDAAARWVADPGLSGLGIVVAGSVDSFSVSDGVVLAQAALGGDDPGMRARMIRRFARSERIEVRKVVDGVKP
ncbi:MAG: hypothetical protein V4850_24255 [Myxococcota bacterium]